MTRTEFLAQLAHKLRVLPEGERRDALEYYEGYIADAESETAAMAQLGSPGEVAAMILADFVSKEPAAYTAPHGSMSPHGYAPARDKRSGVRTAWVIIAAIFAVPVGLPLAVAVAATAFALFMALGGVVFSLGVSGVAAIVGGLVSLVATPFLFFQDAGFAALTAGMGLVGLGLGILFIRLAVYSTGGFMGIARFVGKKITRRSERRERTI